MSFIQKKTLKEKNSFYNCSPPYWWKKDQVVFWLLRLIQDYITLGLRSKYRELRGKIHHEFSVWTVCFSTRVTMIVIKLWKIMFWYASEHRCYCQMCARAEILRRDMTHVKYDGKMKSPYAGCPRVRSCHSCQIRCQWRTKNRQN